MKRIDFSASLEKLSANSSQQAVSKIAVPVLSKTEFAAGIKGLQSCGVPALDKETLNFWYPQVAHIPKADFLAQILQITATPNTPPFMSIPGLIIEGYKLELERRVLQKETERVKADMETWEHMSEGVSKEQFQELRDKIKLTPKDKRKY